MKKTRGLFITLIFATALAQPALSKSFQNKYRTKSQFNIKKSNLVAPNSNYKSQSTQLRSSAPRNSSSSNPFGSRADSFGIMKRDDSFVHLNPETAFGPEIVESFDFPDTDILELTKHMQKLTGINLILDKDVKGKVSISAPSAITVGDAWRAYLTALNMNGFTIVPSGDNFYKIIPARNIRNTPTRIYTGGYTPDTDNYIMKVIPLKHINASEVNKAFRSFMTANGRIIPMEQTNTVLVMDTGTNISRLLKLIKYLDVPGYDESLQIIPVKNSSAQEIAKLLDEILNKSSGGSSRRSSRSSSKDNDEAGISKIIAEPRTNSIIAMANADGAKQLRELIKKLDIAGSSANSGKIHVYYLQYGDAEELSQTLSGLLSAAGSGRSSSGAAGSSRFSSRNNTSNQIFTDEVKVTADKNNNALVVTASPTDWLTMQGVLKKLDIPKDQVMVEGMVVETEVSKGRSFGSNIVSATGENLFDRAGFDTAGIPLDQFITQGFPSLGGLFAGIGIGQTIPVEISGQTYNVSSVNALIQAVASNQGNNVLATPKILVMDNKDAEFEVGSTVPITTSTPGTGTVGPTQSITNQKITLRFKITPQINKVTRFVKLKIDQTIDDIAANQNVQAQVQANTGVQTTTRSAITEVVIKDKDTVVMGGLLRDRENINIKKVPVLGDIPVLGWLFKNKSRDITKTNILFFITPTILSPYDKVANDITEKSLRKRDEFIRPALNDGQDMPFEKEMADLMNKVQAQKSGPLYDQQDAEVYRKANEEAEVELLELELPEYEKAIEIMKE